MNNFLSLICSSLNDKTLLGSEDCSKTKSFNYRFDKMINEGFFETNKIDTFFIFGGTNDTWANSPLGEIKYVNKTEKDLFSVLPAFCAIIEKAKKHCPNARIITFANDILKPEIINCFKEITDHYGTKLILLENIEKLQSHPIASGMKRIFEQVLENL